MTCRPTLTWPQLAALSAPTFVFTGFYWSLTTLLPSFLTQGLGLSLGLAATLLSAVRLGETLIAPLVGMASDAGRAPIGRRKVWMVAAAPGVMLASGAIYFAQPVTPLWQIAAALTILCFGWTMINIPHGAWALEIGGTSVERARIFGARSVAGYIAFIVFALGAALVEHFEPGNSVARQVAVIGGLILVTLPLTLAGLAFVVPERPAEPSRFTASLLWRTYFLALRQKKFWPVAGLFSAVGLYNAVEAGLYVFLVRFGFGLGGQGMALLFIQFVCGLLGVVLWLAIHRRLGTMPTLRLIAWLQLGLSVALGFLPYGAMGPFLALTVLRGLVNGTEFMLLRSLLGDLLDDHAARHRDVPGGAYYASFHFLLDVTAALATFAILHALQATGLDPRQPAAVSIDLAARIKWLAVAGLSIPPALMLLLLGSRVPAQRWMRIDQSPPEEIP